MSAITIYCCDKCSVQSTPNKQGAMPHDWVTVHTTQYGTNWNAPARYLNFCSDCFKDFKKVIGE